MRDNVTLLAGAEQVDAAPWLPFDPRAVDFLAELSAEVLRGPDTRRQEASAAFGFWCRRARLEALAARHASPLPRLGRGLAFHLAPANVPALFAYTLAIGLLAGLVLCMKQAKRYGLTEDNVLDMVLWAVPSCIIGARLYYVIFYLDLYRNADGSLNWGEMVAVWDGGLAIYGAVIAGAIVTTLTYGVVQLF